MTIVDFLLARIAEDENASRIAAGTPEAAQNITRWHPTRVLAECQAKRAIIEEHREQTGYIIAYRQSDRLIAEGYDLDTVPLQASAALIPTCLRRLAAVYADHPDYDPAWRLS